MCLFNAELFFGTEIFLRVFFFGTVFQCTWSVLSLDSTTVFVSSLFFQGERHLWPPPTFTVSLLVCVCVFHPKGVRSLNNVRVFFVIDYNH